MMSTMLMRKQRYGTLQTDTGWYEDQASLLTFDPLWISKMIQGRYEAQSFAGL